MTRNLKRKAAKTVAQIPKPIVWTIAGSDSSAGAGIQADLHTFQALGVYGCSVITAITAQNSRQILSVVPMSAETFQSQLDALTQDFPPVVVKIGMLGSSYIINILIAWLKKFSGFVILDPVLKSSTGMALLSVPHKNDPIESLKKIFPYIDLITPNFAEAELLTGIACTSPLNIEAAADQLHAAGIDHVVIKGGHGETAISADYYSCVRCWNYSDQKFWVNQHRIYTPHTHGTGCTFSSAVAASVAQGYAIDEAVVIAKMTIQEGIRHAVGYGQGSGPVTHHAWPENHRDLCWITSTDEISDPVDRFFSFPDCGPDKLGFYPIVDSSAWIECLLAVGVRTIQLRIKQENIEKTKAGEEKLNHEIMRAIEIARSYDARLFINDHWELAIHYGAYGIHLGQSDLDLLSVADKQKLKQSGCRLGISTHNYTEVARAHALRPSYIACGPIFETTTKHMPFKPQGVNRLQRWCRTLNYPVVAIGGICLDNLESVLATGVDGVAVISAIVKDKRPEAAAKKWCDIIQEIHQSHQQQPNNVKLKTTMGKAVLDRRKKERS